MNKAVVFDLDDTLYPEMEYVISGFKAVADFIYIKNEKNYFNQIMELFKINKNKVFNRLIDNNKLKINSMELVNIYQKHKPKIKFYSDVLPFIEFLKSKQIKVGIITDGRPEGQRAKLEALQCYDIFDKIIITDELGGIKYRKPHPLAYEIMAKSLNVEYNSMIYIGDNPKKDFGISKIYPIKTIWIKRNEKGIHSENEITCNPNYTINCFKEIKERKLLDEII